MKLEKYVDKNVKRRKIVLISLGVVVLISVSFLLYKTFASFTESAEFPIMNGKVDYFGNSDVYFVFYKGDKELEEMPQKDNPEKLEFDYASCDNGASIIWDKEEWAPLVKGLNSVKTKCSLYFKEYDPDIAVNYITELAKIDPTNLAYDGKEILGELGTEDNNLRYIGVNSNNYIDIGDRDINGNPILWRIIGVMNNITNLDNGGQQESLVKIIRSVSIGSYSWDSSAEGINNGYGVNEWSEADLMKLLNPPIYNTIPSIGNSLYWFHTNGNCYNGLNEINTPCDFTSSGISEEAKEKIAKVRWNTGTIGEKYDLNNITSKKIYEGERSIYSGKELCKNTEGNWCNDTVPRTTTWDGYIGLMYPSDYGYAVGGDIRTTCLGKGINEYSNYNCSKNDWLTTNNNSWTITPTPDNYTLCFNGSSASFYNFPCGLANEVWPVAYLKSSIKIKKSKWRSR